MNPMRKRFFRFKEAIRRNAVKIVTAGTLSGRTAAGRVLANRSGEGYIDTAVKILIAVVLGALLLAGLYALFGDTVMPELTRRIQEMFNYNG
jgi:hypothetical protein